MRDSRKNDENERRDPPIALKKFRFKLQTVLDYRQEYVGRVQQKVAHEQKKALEIIHRIDEIDASLQRAFNEYDRMLEGGQDGLDVNTTRYFSHFVQQQKFRRAQFEKRLAQQNQVLNRVRQELHQALVAQKSLEKLKEKEYRQYCDHIEREEEKFLSEIALNRMARRR